MKLLTTLFAVLLFLGCDEKSQSAQSCGDGVIDVGEDCDGAELGGSSCLSLGYNGGTLSCDNDCHFILSECEGAGSCGDGLVQTEYGEECEPGVSTESCEELNLGTGTATCDGSCHYDYSGCTAVPVCGDGDIEGAEECEGSNLNSATCQSLGYYGGTLTCNTLCYFDVSHCREFGRCGDGIMHTEEGEECEVGDLQGATCESMGHEYGGELACNDECQFDLSGCLGWCGDGLIQENFHEQCDDTEFDGVTCENLGFYGGEIACSAECQLDASDCESFGQCGDGIIQGSYGENCDGTNLGVMMCEDFGFLQGGMLLCSDCEFDDSYCNRFETIAAGVYYSCGLNNDGAAYCWGSNSQGKLGDGTTDSRAAPTMVEGGITFASLSTGQDHTCGLTAAGTAYCWGDNNSGQLGNGTTTDSAAPVLVSGGLTFTSISVGGSHTGGVTASGNGYCWGANGYGQIGSTAAVIHQVTPIEISGGYSFSSVQAGGYHSCGLTTGGAALCWGSNLAGQLGDGTTTDSDTPVTVSGGIVFTDVWASLYRHSCGLTAAGVAYCWGWNDNGELGDGTTTSRSVPTAVSGGYTFTSISPGSDHSCGLMAGGVAYCWGRNAYGQIGDGTTQYRFVPTPVSGGLNFASLNAGGYHTCGLTAAGVAYCWGSNDEWECGAQGSNLYVPTAVSPF